MYCCVDARYPHITPWFEPQEDRVWELVPQDLYLLGHIVLNLNPWPHGTRLITPLMRLGQACIIVTKHGFW